VNGARNRGEVEPAPAWDAAASRKRSRTGEPWIGRAADAPAPPRRARRGGDALAARGRGARRFASVGMVSALDYLERVLCYGPRTAQDGCGSRVSRDCQLTAALAGDELAFSAARVATPATEVAWIAAAAGKNLRQVEDLCRRPSRR